MDSEGERRDKAAQGEGASLMRYAVLLALASLVLTGCATTAPPPTPEQLYAQAYGACQSYGFTPKTDAFADCMMKIDMFEKQAAINQAQMNQAEFAASMRALAARRSVTCNTAGSANALGNTVYGNSSTTCQ